MRAAGTTNRPLHEFYQRRRSKRTREKKKRGAGACQGHAGAQKNLRLCRVDAFENPQLNRGASGPVFGSHYKGWACKHRKSYWLPAGTPSVRQKDRPITNTAEVVRLSPTPQFGLYHGRGGRARCCSGALVAAFGGGPTMGCGGAISLAGRGLRRGRHLRSLSDCCWPSSACGATSAPWRNIAASPPSSLPPSVVVLVVLGAVATRKESLRKHAMHAAAAVGCAGLPRRPPGAFLYKLFTGGDVMNTAGLEHGRRWRSCATCFVALCVKSSAAAIA